MESAMDQVPLGPTDKDCPYHRKVMAEVCHRCPLWINVKGKDPQSAATIDRWGCAHMWQPVLTVENTQVQRETGAAVEELRNHVVAANAVALTLAERGLWPPSPEAATMLNDMLKPLLPRKIG
jgi:hypothetical protein